MLEQIFRSKSVHEYMITFIDIQKYLTYGKLITGNGEKERAVESNVKKTILNIWNDIFGRVSIQQKTFLILEVIH